ncbi:MAG: hypothetical protein AAF434_09335 [Pseudomonadota bacterium]
MVVFLLQLALFILVAILLGFALGILIKQYFSSYHLNTISDEVREMKLSISRTRRSLQDCEARRDVLTHDSSTQPRSLVEDSVTTNQIPDFGQSEKGICDDLQLISGIGPKLEATLNELGICRFQQIASLTDVNVAWVDSYLRFKGRIGREMWIEQAKVLAEGGTTEFSSRKKRKSIAVDPD